MNKQARFLATLVGWLLAAVVHAGTVTYIHTDAQGTPVMESDAQGHITKRFEYTPYGVVVTSMGAAPDGPGYTGHVNDPETGLVYMQARYYDPVGRMLSVDPAGPTPGNVYSFNRYAYANNNPIRNIDPDGRMSVYPRETRDLMGNFGDNSELRREEKYGCAACLQANGGSKQVVNLASINSNASSPGNDANTALNVTDAALSAYMLRAPEQLGHWQMGNLAISRYIGATRQEVARFAKIGKVANGISFLAIGSSSFSLVDAARNGDTVGAIGAGSDLGWSLFGLTGPVGAVGATAYGVTSLVVQIPTVNKWTVQPATNLMCGIAPNCR